MFQKRLIFCQGTAVSYHNHLKTSQWGTLKFQNYIFPCFPHKKLDNYCLWEVCDVHFFAKTDLVRDLRALALPCCTNDYGGAKSGGKRISLRKGEI